MSQSPSTKEKIIKVATKLFAEEGFYNITFTKIAQAVGISQPGIYRHFSDMDDLILQSCSFWVNEASLYLNEHITGLENAKESLFKYIQINLEYSDKNRAKDSLLLGLYYYAMRSAKIKSFYNDTKKGGINRIKQILAHGNHEKIWQVKDLESKAYFIHSVMVGEIIKMLIDNKEEKLQSRIQRVQKEVLLNLGISKAGRI